MKRTIAALAAVLACAWSLSAAERVEIRFDLPAGLGAYTGLQPVTFGVPFEKGKLMETDGVRVVDALGKKLAGQFEVTGTWGPDSHEVRWLLVDCLADIREGVAQKAFLEFGADVPGEPAASAEAPRSGMGDFALMDGEGKRYRCASPQVTVERSGPVRRVTKLSGKYLAEDGTSIADYVTRVRSYAGCPFVRVYHTMIWTVDEKVKIGALTFTLPGAAGEVRAGVDGKPVLLAANAPLWQRDWNVVGGAAEGRHLDGWIEAAGEKRTFAALRWAWQQFPVSLASDGRGLVVGLIGAEKPVSLAAADAAVKAVQLTGKLLENGGRDSWDTNSNVPYKPGGKKGKEGWISPRGVAKTYELLIWPGDDAIRAETKNLLFQHPVFAYADPVFAVRAGLPNPASAYDPKAFPMAEAALRRAFGWATREQAVDGDYGAWNWGDIQWHWMEQGGYAVYRYWMNNGKGWSIVPWALWIRSGDRACYEHGEANSRHVMDIDTCHVDDGSLEGKPRDGKVKGGVYHYCALHWAYGPRVLPFYVDSEYLPNYHHMTGYERAKDVMMERVTAIVGQPAHAEGVITAAQDPMRHGRHISSPTRDILLLYEATWNPTLGKYARTLVDLMLKAQQPDGKFYGVKTNHYLDMTLHFARRILAAEKGDALAQAIVKWTVFTGNNETGGPALGIEDGWFSLWSQVAAGEQTGEAHYLRRAARILNAQTAVVDDSSTEWRGITPIFLHEIGPALRDWTIVMGALSRIPPEQRDTTYEPMTYIIGLREPSAADKAAGWKYRELALILNEKGDPASLRVHMWAGGVGETPCHVRLRGPDNALVINEERKVTFSDQYGDKARQTVSGPVVLEVPGGRSGVYALEVLMKDRRPCMCVLASTGRVVYPLPQKTGAFFFSPVYAGQVWFEPLGGEPVVLSFPANQVMGRMTLFGPDGVALASNQATGTRIVKAADHGLRPDGQPIRVVPRAAGLHCFLTPVPRDKNCVTYVSGCKPWFSGRRSEWFDPEQYAHPDFDLLLK